MGPFFRSKKDRRIESNVPGQPWSGNSASPEELLAVFSSGYWLCPDCGGHVEFGVFDGLTVEPCPYCDHPVFVPQRIGNYYLYGPAGGGGMGSVYRAVCSEYSDEFFAVKVLPRGQQSNPELGAKLESEARTAALFYEVPNCENAVEFGYADGEYFFAMEYIEGPRLDNQIDIHGAFQWPEVVRIALQIAETEAAICGRGYLYRDLKPENVILNPEHGPALVDFGLCLPMDDAKHHPSDDIEGSVYYIPPERVAGLGEDCRSEIYSLGMLLFHMLTGETFFSGAEAADLAVQHVLSERLEQCMARLKKKAPDTLCSLVMHMIPRRREQRIASFSLVQKALREILDGAPSATP